MPVTKTAKRALRSSAKKGRVNTLVKNALDIAIRKARKSKLRDAVLKAISLADKAAKKKAIHKNKAARIKSQLTKLISAAKTSAKKKPSKKK